MHATHRMLTHMCTQKQNRTAKGFPTTIVTQLSSKSSLLKYNSDRLTKQLMTTPRRRRPLVTTERSLDYRACIRLGDDD